MTAIGSIVVRGAALLSLGALLATPPRRLANFVADITISEDHQDQLRITDHPVEQGAVITDHAFKMPAQLMLRIGWAAGLSNVLNTSYLNQVYSALLELQNSRVPFDVYTARRVYTNMLLEGLGVTTNKDTANILMVTARCREVIIVQTQVITVPDNAVQADPQRTGGVVDMGTQLLAPSQAALPPGGL